MIVLVSLPVAIVLWTLWAVGWLVYWTIRLTILATVAAFMVVAALLDRGERVLYERRQRAR